MNKNLSRLKTKFSPIFHKKFVDSWNDVRRAPKLPTTWSSKISIFCWYFFFYCVVIVDGVPISDVVIVFLVIENKCRWNDIFFLWFYSTCRDLIMFIFCTANHLHISLNNLYFYFLSVIETSLALLSIMYILIMNLYFLLHDNQ